MRYYDAIPQFTLTDMNTPRTNSNKGTPLPRLLHPNEVAHILGRSRDWVCDEVQAGRLPARRVGRMLRFHPDDLVEYLDDRRTAAPTTLEAE